MSDGREARNATDQEKLERVICWLTNGNDAFEVKRLLREEFGDGDVERHLSAAIDILTNAANEPLPAVVGWAIKSLQVVFKKALDVGDHGPAIRAIKEIVALRDKYVFDNAEGDEEPDGNDND